LLAGYLLSALFLSSLRWLITATLDASLDHLVGGQYDDPRMFTLAFGVAGEITIEDFGRFNGLLKTLRYAEVDDAFSALTVRTANAGLWQSWLGLSACVAWARCGGRGGGNRLRTGTGECSPRGGPPCP
jgi:hypothetical protein